MFSIVLLTQLYLITFASQSVKLNFDLVRSFIFHFIDEPILYFIRSCFTQH